MAVISRPDTVGRARSDAFRSVGATPLRLAPELFADAARRFGDRPALIAGDRTLSYAALDALVDARRRAFADAGLRSGDRIGIALPRRAEAVIAILAAMRCGLVYVPLDPAHPEARRAAIVADAGLRALLEDGRPLALRPRPIATSGCALGHDVRHDDAGSGSVPAAPADDPTVAPYDNLDVAPRGGDALAYIIYTSGSTGTPKGVAIRHASLAHLIDSMRRAPGLSETDTVLATAAFSFDMSVPDLFLTFAVGAALVLATEEEAIDGAALVRLVACHRVTMMQSTPSRFRLMLEAGWPEAGERTLRILCGGEAMTRALADSLSRRGALWNMYGPTETTVWSTARELLPGTGDLAIGGPIGGTILRVVGENGQDAETGALGELLIGGPGVAASYVGRPELTAERFVPDAEGTVFYRTGDIVRVRGDGHFDFAGRNDHQIKVGGVRIEPAEIEAAIGSHPAVGEVLAIARPDRDGRLVLVAYATARRDAAPPTTEALEALAAATLPATMWPRVVVLDGFPLNANGKVDRGRLPAPPPRAIVSGLPPETETERQLAAIWAEALGTVSVGRHDDFLALGGDSLAATVTDGLIEARFGFRLGVATLVRTTVLAEQALRIDALRAQPDVARRATTAADAVQILSWNDGAPGVAVAGLHNLVPFRALAATLAGRHRFDAIALSRQAGIALSDAGEVEDVGAIYADILAARSGADPVVVLGWCASGVVALDAARRLTARGGNVPLVVLVDPEPVGLLAQVIRQGRIAFGALRRRLRGHAVGSASPLDASGALSHDEGGFRWLDDAIARHRPASVAIPTLVLMPTHGNPLLAATRRRAWRRALGPAVRFDTVDGDHATVFAATGAGRIAELVHAAVA